MRNEQNIIAGSKRGLEPKYQSFSSFVFCFVPLLLKFKKHL
jgi:hypothetical protein